MHTQFYTLRALTPLHAGAGDANFGIIDKHVQRDSLTELPTIFASSIKGSLRQLCEVSAQVGKDTVRTIFGSDNPKGEAGATTLQQGQYIFYPGKTIGPADTQQSRAVLPRRDAPAVAGITRRPGAVWWGYRAQGRT